MPNINAALGCAQLEKLPSKLENKRNLFEMYKSEFSKVNGISLIEEPSGCKSNYWLQGLKLDSPDLNLRDKILDKLNAAELMSRPAWNLTHLLKPYLECPSMNLENSISLFESIINIPSSKMLN
jgi:perosamine synthetase